MFLYKMVVADRQGDMFAVPVELKIIDGQDVEVMVGTWKAGVFPPIEMVVSDLERVRSEKERDPLVLVDTGK